MSKEKKSDLPTLDGLTGFVPNNFPYLHSMPYLQVIKYPQLGIVLSRPNGKGPFTYKKL